MKTNRKLPALAGALFLGFVLAVSRLFNAENILILIGPAGYCLGAGLYLGKAPAPEISPRSDLFKTAVVLAAIITLGGTALKAATALGNILAMCAVALLALSAFGMILGLKETDSELPHIMVSLPIFACGLYLLDTYKLHVAAGSNVHIYAFEILTVLFLTAALYSVAAMRFTDHSRSPFITTTILGAVLLTLATAISTLFGPFIFSMADLLICIGLALYCAAWYLNPPFKYIVPEEENEDEEDSDDDDTIVIVPENDEE